MGFVSTDVGREIIALQDKPARGLVAGETYLITNVITSNDASHDGTCDPSSGCLGAEILFSHLDLQWRFADSTPIAPTTTIAPISTTIAPTTTIAPVVISGDSNLTTLSDYIEIRNNLLSALKELSKVTINQYSVQERQVIHERRSEIRRELKHYDRKIALLEKTAKGYKNPSLENFRTNDAI